MIKIRFCYANFATDVGLIKIPPAHWQSYVSKLSPERHREERSDL